MKWVEVKCDRCNRHGRYRWKRFFEIAGTDHPPDALPRFAAKVGCERAAEQVRQLIRHNQLITDDRCGIQYFRRDG